MDLYKAPKTTKDLGMKEELPGSNPAYDKPLRTEDDEKRPFGAGIKFGDSGTGESYIWASWGDSVTENDFSVFRKEAEKVAEYFKFTMGHINFQAGFEKDDYWMLAVIEEDIDPEKYKDDPNYLYLDMN